MTATAASIVDHSASIIGPFAAVVGSICDSAVALVTFERRTKAKIMTIMPRENRQVRPSFCFIEI